MAASRIVLPRLYAIVDVEVAGEAGWSPLDLARAYLAGGARLLQLRAKNLASGAFLALGRAVHAAAEPVDARVVVNDRADVAWLAGIRAVHVGQTDLPVESVRAMLGPDAVIGLSTHSSAQVEAAASLPIDYLAVGPVFDTSTKATGYSIVGLDLVRRAAALQSGSPPRPIVAIGGITLERAPAVIEAGATSVAVISDLLTGGDPEARVRAFAERLDD